MPSHTLRRIARVQVVEVVQVVAPELVEAGIVPAVRCKIAGVVQKTKAIGTDQARNSLRARLPGRADRPDGRRRTQIHARSRQPEPDSSVDLNRLQVADG